MFKTHTKSVNFFSVLLLCSIVTLSTISVSTTALADDTFLDAIRIINSDSSKDSDVPKSTETPDKKVGVETAHPGDDVSEVTESVKPITPPLLSGGDTPDRKVGVEVAHPGDDVSKITEPTNFLKKEILPDIVVGGAVETEDIKKEGSDDSTLWSDLLLLSLMAIIAIFIITLLYRKFGRKSLPSSDSSLKEEEVLTEEEFNQKLDESMSPPNTTQTADHDTLGIPPVEGGTKEEEVLTKEESDQKTDESMSPPNTTQTADHDTLGIPPVEGGTKEEEVLTKEESDQKTDESTMSPPNTTQTKQ